MGGPASQTIPLPFALLDPASRSSPQCCASPEPADSASSTTCSDSCHASLPRSTVQLLDRIQWQGATTLVMHNVPSRFSMELLIECLQPEGDIDFIFLPFRPRRRCCSRYAFVNFVNSEAARQFAKKWTDTGTMLWGTSISAQCKQARPLGLGLATTQGLASNLQLHMEALLRNDSCSPAVYNCSERLRFPHDWAKLIGMVSEHEWASIKDTMFVIFAEAREGGAGPDAIYTGAPKSLKFSLHL
eukprot:TRINITY_DN18260_c0_g3_i3.p1 TRINITY_DN18260_c0_g3~~TRINITY_DN18260_c0_g3_i3.p1  ORF type:complete len:244 (-),score=32.92 TRINITY_DN18260_c0_g3_i3:220-951(-)